MWLLPCWSIALSVRAGAVPAALPAREDFAERAPTFSFRARRPTSARSGNSWGTAVRERSSLPAATSVASSARTTPSVQIYMPDLKFTDPAVADELTGAPDYPVRVREAIREMHDQVGDLENDSEGAARRGLLVRHLVMPGGLAGTAEAMRFLAEEISLNTRVNIMDQYRPCFRAVEVSRIAQPATDIEYGEALAAARHAGLLRAE